MATTLKCKISKHMTERRCIANQVEAEEIFGDKARECNSCPCDVGLSIRAGKDTSVTKGSARDTIALVGLESNPAPIPVGQASRLSEEEKSMVRKRGICVNCERPDMAMFHGDLCGSCASAIVGLKEADKEAALAKAAAKFTGKPKLRRGKYKRKVESKPQIKPETCPGLRSGSGAPQSGSPPPVSPKVEETKIHVIPDADPVSRKAGIPNDDADIIILRFQTEADHKLLAALAALAQQYRRTPDQQILWMVQNQKQLHEDLIKEAEG